MVAYGFTAMMNFTFLLVLIFIRIFLPVLFLSNTLSISMRQHNIINIQSIDLHISKNYIGLLKTVIIIQLPFKGHPLIEC